MEVSLSAGSRPRQFLISIEGEPWREIHQSIFGRRPVFQSCSNQAEWDKYFDALEFKLTKTYLYRRLASQSYHSSKLRRLLKERLVSKKSAEGAIAVCVEQGYIQDEDWIDRFVRSQRKRQSLRYVLAKMRIKGISQEELERIENQWNIVDDEEAILRLLNSKYRNTDLNDYQERKKVCGALYRKGFMMDAIQSALTTAMKGE